MYLRIHEAAQRIGCSPSTLRNYDRAGELVPLIRFENGERRYTEEQVDAFIASIENKDRKKSGGNV